MSKRSRIAIGVAIVVVLACAVPVGKSLGELNGTKGTTHFDPENPDIVRARNAISPELTKVANTAVEGLPVYSTFHSDKCHRGTRGGFLNSYPDDYQWSCDIVVGVMAGVSADDADAAIEATQKAVWGNCPTTADSTYPLPDPDATQVDLDAPSDDMPSSVLLIHSCSGREVMLFVQRSDSRYLRYAVPQDSRSGDYWEFVPHSQPDGEKAVAQLRADSHRYAVVAKVKERRYYEMKWPDV